jgi:hypothetical protein
MNNYKHILEVVLASFFIVFSAYASPPMGVPMAQAEAQQNIVAVANSPGQVTSATNATNALDNQTVVRSVQTSAPVYASRPSFDALDMNHDGFISETEAMAYPLLANDYLHVARKGSRGVTRAEYDHW